MKTRNRLNYRAQTIAFKHYLLLELIETEQKEKLWYEWCQNMGKNTQWKYTGQKR